MRILMRLVAMLAFAAVGIVGCSTPAPPPVDPAYEALVQGAADNSADEEPEGAVREPDPLSIPSVSNVLVKINPGSLAPAVVARLEKHNGVDIIRRSIFAELDTRKRLDSESSYTLNARIVYFKLRTTAASFWLGIMAGRDHLFVEVDVLKEGERLKTLQVKASSGKGGILFPSSTGRFNNLARAIGVKLSADLFVK